MKPSLLCPTYTTEVLVFIVPLYALAWKFHSRVEKPFATEWKPLKLGWKF